MHDTAYQIGRRFIEAYCSLQHTQIVEIGSLNVNGSLHDFKPKNVKYLGVDFESGSGVDVVSIPGEPIPVDDKSADCVIASSVFEHDAAFWSTFLELCRITRHGGYIYINAPSNGTIHRYPEDCWRFYPDAGIALERWGRSKSFDIQLIESFTCDRQDDHWNDFVAIFRVGSGELRSVENTVFSNFKAKNVWWQGKFLAPDTSTEDMRIIEELKTNLRNLENANILSEIAFIKNKLLNIENGLMPKHIDLENQLYSSQKNIKEQSSQIKNLKLNVDETEALLKKRDQELFAANEYSNLLISKFDTERLDFEKKILDLTAQSKYSIDFEKMLNSEAQKKIDRKSVV